MPIHVILLNLIILIILGEEYKLWTLTLCIFLHPPITSSLLHANILVSTLFTNTLSLPQYCEVDHSLSPQPNRRDSNVSNAPGLFVLLYLSH
jgi:hypothetical protein